MGVAVAGGLSPCRCLAPRPSAPVRVRTGRRGGPPTRYQAGQEGACARLPAPPSGIEIRRRSSRKFGAFRRLGVHFHTNPAGALTMAKDEFGTCGTSPDGHPRHSSPCRCIVSTWLGRGTRRRTLSMLCVTPKATDGPWLQRGPATAGGSCDAGRPAIPPNAGRPSGPHLGTPPIMPSN